MEGLMDPQNVVVLPEGTVISAKLQGDIGPCAMIRCTGTVRRFATPVVHPFTGQRSERVIFACSEPDCTCTCARASEETVRALAAESGYDLEHHRFIDAMA